MENTWISIRLHPLECQDSKGNILKIKINEKSPSNNVNADDEIEVRVDMVEVGPVFA